MMLLYAIALILVNFILYFFFGLLLWPLAKKEGFSVCRTVFSGFFLYYLLFSLICIPVMLRWRPLSFMTRIWTAVLLLVFRISLGLFRREWKGLISRMGSAWKTDWWFWGSVLALVIVQALFILMNYQFTLDAAYYVANVTTSLKTDMMNVYDPYTGEWQDHFQIRYFFASYSMNDAVMCRLFHVHPLIWCKTTMAGTAIALTNMVLCMIGRELFPGRRREVLLFLFFAGVMNFFFITIFTSSNFLLTRTYEGKCLLANVVLPGVLYLMMALWKDTKSLWGWVMLLVMSMGSSALSSSANMLLPAAMGVTILPLALIRHDIKVVWKTAACMVPSLLLMLAYVAYVKGVFVFYTYPK
ncbi:MAG: hypothetical protein K6F35_02955 [Lachnospiraceae bacterium]|nr:hypothetical protein [Lachnospiraceae bacterium]